MNISMSFPRTQCWPMTALSLSLSFVVLILANSLPVCFCQHLEQCDAILVMREGQLVERGSHQELLSIGGDYVNLLNVYKQEKCHRSRSIDLYEMMRVGEGEDENGDGGFGEGERSDGDDSGIGHHDSKGG